MTNEITSINEMPDNSGLIGLGFLRRSGLLFKINEQLLHPLGLALAVVGEKDSLAPVPDFNADTKPVQLILIPTEGGPWTFSPDIVEMMEAMWAQFLDNAEAIRERIYTRSARSEVKISTVICSVCREPIYMVDGLWCDGTIANPIASASFAAMCEDGGVHRP